MEPRHAADPLSDSALADEVAGSMFDLFRAMAAAYPGGELEEHDGYAMHAAAPANPMLPIRTKPPRPAPAAAPKVFTP